MPVHYDCSSSLVAFFPPAIYQSAGSSTVLPDLLQSVGQDAVSTVQFLRNGAARITFKTAAQCDRVVAAGIVFRDTPLRVVSADARSRLVYLRDCPAEVPDDVVKRFFLSFGEVHLVSRSCHQAFPGIRDGNRVIRITLTKDVPGSVSISGYECRVWYRRQPASCAICKKVGHRSKSCPLSGLCRRCRRPGHHARHCTNAWVAAPQTSGAARPPPSTPAEADVPAEADSPAVVDTPAEADAPAEAVSTEADVPVVTDVPAADPPGPVDAPAVQDAEMSDLEYLPQSGVESDDSASMEEVMASGDDEVVAAALSPGLSDSPRLGRKRGAARFRPPSPVWLLTWTPRSMRFLVTATLKPSVESGKTGFPGRFIVPGNLVIKGLKLQSLCHPLLLFFSPPKIFLLLLLLRVPPATPVPSSVSSDGSVVDSVKSPSPGRRRSSYDYYDKLWGK